MYTAECDELQRRTPLSLTGSSITVQFTYSIRALESTTIECTAEFKELQDTALSASSGTTVSRGRILSRNPDKGLNISSNSRNLLKFLQTVKEKGEKPDRNPRPLHGLRNRRTLKIMPRNLKEIVRLFMNSAYMVEP